MRGALTADRGRRGQATIEFSLCAIFIIFLVISIVDMARGLWINHTLAEAVRDGTRFAIVRGNRYVFPNTTNRLTDGHLKSVRDVVVRGAIGLDPEVLNLTFECLSPTCPVVCNPSTSGPCAANPSSTWPPRDAADEGQEIGIVATYPYNSLVIMYFPGGKGLQFGNYILGSVARERMVF